MIFTKETLCTTSIWIKNLLGDYAENINEVLKEKNRFYPAPAISDPKKIGYFTSKKLEVITADNYYDPKTRQKYGIMTRPGKFFRHILPDLNGNEIKSLVSEYYNIINIQERTKTFKKTYDIKWAYHEDNYEYNHGSLGASCMRYDNCQEWLEFYDNYGVRVLVLMNEDEEIIGRALLWRDVYFKHLNIEKTFMDRIYTADENDELLFKNYANENGFVHKEKQNYDNKDLFVYNKESFKDLIQINPKKNYIPEYAPYLDTMTYADKDFNLSNTGNSEFCIDLDSTDGNIEGFYTCEDCGRQLIEDTGEVYIEEHGYVCEDCLNQEYFECYECKEYHSIHENSTEDITGNTYCKYCANNYLFYCNDCEEYHHVDYEVSVDNGYVCEDCFKEYEMCEECEEYFLKSELKSHEDENYCESCYCEIQKASENTNKEIA